MVKIYTRSGDKGRTHLFGGSRVSKNNPRVRAYGTVDELNGLLGVVRAHCEDTDISEKLREIQSLLFVCGADLATPEPDADGDQEGEQQSTVGRRIRKADTEKLEEWIDSYTEDLEPLQNFVLPGGSPVAARLQFARGICRRAERATVSLQEDGVDVGNVLPFLNRLSDFLFTLARVVNQREGVDEIPWKSPL